MGADRGLVPRIDAQAEVIHVAAVRGRGAAAVAPEDAVDRHEVDQGAAGAQLHEADRVLAALDGAAEDAAVESEHRLEVEDAQHEMVDVADADHASSTLRRDMAAANSIPARPTSVNAKAIASTPS